MSDQNRDGHKGGRGPVRSRAAVALFVLLGSGCAEQAPKEAPEQVPEEALQETPRAKDEPGHARMLALLKDIEQRTGQENIYIGDSRARQLRERLALFNENTPQPERLLISFRLGEAELALGNERDAIRHLSDAYALIPQVGQTMPPPPPEVIHQMTFRLAVAYLRLGETQNCCLRNSPQSCIIPIQGDGIHTQTEGSERAIGYFTEVLDTSAPDSQFHLASQWLLNIAYMTIGKYPDAVPRDYLIPATAFESEEDFPRFTNIASRVGLDTFSLSGGAIADDFDNDHDLDLVVSTWDPSGQIRFHRNNGDGTFTDRTKEAGLTGLYGGLNLVQADYDNDGDVDVLVLRGAWLTTTGRHPNSLLRNNGDGVFTDVTFEAGLAEEHAPTQTAAWADYDNDGDLDLYIGNESLEADFPCQLFRNDGDGTFTDVAQSAGVENLRYTKSVVWGDYDADRFPDLYVSNLMNPNRLYRNNGDGTFTDVAPQLGTTEPTYSFPSWFWDFDNDGNLDLFVSAYSAGVGDLAAVALGHTVGANHFPRLYRGDGEGGFQEVSGERHLARPSAPMGSNFGDLDNDGYLDFYLGTGNPEYEAIMPNIMYHNRGGSHFTDVTIAGGFGHLQKGHGVVFADLDNDGDQDIFQQMGGALPGDKFNDVLYQNPGFGNRWINVKAVGVESNRSAIGARMRVDVIADGRRRTVYRYVNSGGSFGANPLRQTIGLGNATSIERLEIFWPTTGRTQQFTDIPLDRFVEVVEGETEFRILPVRAHKLGAP